MIVPKRLNCESGQILTTFVLFIPILLALIAVLFFSGQYLSHRTENLKICRSELHTIQKNMKHSLEKLQSLNPRAKQLRLWAKWAKNAAKYGSSLNAAIGVTGAAAFVYVRTAQVALRSQQMSILSKASILAKSKTALLFSQLGARSEGFFNSGESLQVYGKPLTSITPSYFVKPAFSQLQEIKIHWKESPLPSNNIFSKILTFIDMKRITNRCSATLVHRGKVWEVSIK